MYIEELELRVAETDLAGYLATDAAVWTAFLSEQAGFVAKHVLRPVDRPGTVILFIWWESREHWRAVDDSMCAEVDRRMGRYLPEFVACREYEVLRVSGAR